VVSRGDRRSAERRASRRTRRRRLAQIGAAVLAIAGIVGFIVLRPGHGSDRRTGAAPSPTATGANLADPQLASAFLGGAASDIAAVTTYDYRSLDDALNAGSAVTTGSYRRAYRAALTGDLAATATQNHVVHTFELLELGLGEVNSSRTQAKVLVFGRQRVSDDSTGGRSTTSPVTLCATIVRNGNRYLISNLVEGGNAGLPPGGTDLPVAAEAARTEVINLLSFRRSTFDADLERALSGAVSPLRNQLVKNAPVTESGMEKGKYDLSGSVTGVAVVRSSDDSVTMLVAADSVRTPDSGRTAVSPERYVVTVTRTAGSWAVSQAGSVDGT
jgi:hypothetical protein